MKQIIRFPEFKVILPFVVVVVVVVVVVSV